jgi:hypothetical protein
VKQRLSHWVILLATALILGACGADQDTPGEESTANKLKFSVGDDAYELPVKLCQISVVFVMIKGWQGESSAALSYDGQSTNVSFEVDFEEGGVHLKDQWESQAEAEHSTDGFTVSSRGTVSNVSRYQRADGETDEWVRLDGPGPLGERPFELSANCPEA